MQRLIALLAVAALAGTAWWIASTISSGPSETAPTPEEGLVVHVHVTDRAGKPVSPAQIVRVYDETRETVDGNGYARLTKVTLRADEEPSAEAFTYAFKVLTRGHALRRGFKPEVTKRDDGAWDVRYALHAHGILRVHVEPVNLGTCKAFLERDEPLRRWEPVGGHAVVRPGSVVDFRIYEGWDAPGHDGKIAVRLKGEPGSDGVTAIATQRVLVDAPSPGHTAQLKLIPEPVDPIAGVVRVKEGPPPPTLRGGVLVHRVQDDGTRVYMGRVPIDDEGSFVIRDAGTETYELIAGLDFAPGVIETKAKGGDYLELETPGRARWATIEHPDLDGTASSLHAFVWDVEPRSDSRALPPSILSYDMKRWLEDINRQMGAGADAQAETASSVEALAWSMPPVLVEKARTFVALAGKGTWSVHLGGDPSLTRAAQAGIREVTLAEDASEATVSIEMQAADHESITVRVAPEGWDDARSATVNIEGLKRSVVKGGKAEVTFPFIRAQPSEVQPGPAQVPMPFVRVTWDDPGIAPHQIELPPLAQGEKRPVLVARARPGGQVRLHMSGPRAAYLRTGLSLLLVPEGKPPSSPATSIELRRRGVEPIWESVEAVLPGRYEASISMQISPPEQAKGTPWAAGHWLLPRSLGSSLPVVIKAGTTTSVEFELPLK